MSAPARLALALDEGGLRLPEEGRIAVFAPRAGDDLSALPRARCEVITGFAPDHAYFSERGYRCRTAPEGRYAAAIVFVARARARSEALVAEAVSVSDGRVVVDGAKTDGVEALLKACRKRAEVAPALSKAHGKLFHFPAGPDAGERFEDWAAAAPREIEGGFVTLPGVFSADGIDPASRLLADHLPKKPGRVLADLGAGWGYLSARALERETVEEIHLVEAELAALDCAKANLQDPRARFHWADATRWRPEAPVDCVITNPPFHAGRSPDPGLGRAFIESARAMLAPRGQLFLVANRHLPYEAEMARHFAEVSEVAGDSRFKLLHGARPRR